MDTEPNEMIEVYLEGGATYMPAEMRRQWAFRDQYKVKVEFCGAHEHFERITPQGATDTPVLFRWTGRTKIAE